MPECVPRRSPPPLNSTLDYPSSPPAHPHPHTSDVTLAPSSRSRSPSRDGVPSPSESNKFDGLLQAVNVLSMTMLESQRRSEALLEKILLAVDPRAVPSNRAGTSSTTPVRRQNFLQIPDLEIAPPATDPPARNTAPPVRVSQSHRNDRQQQFTTNQTEIAARPRLSELPIFGGSEDQLIPWLSNLTEWPRRLGLEILDDFLFRPGPPMVNFLKGPALTWFDDKLTTGGFSSFVDFQKQLLKHVLGYSWRHSLERTIQKRVEGKEPLDIYAANLRHLIFLAYMDYPRSERDERVAYAFSQGLKDPSERLQCLYRLEERRETTVDDLLALLRVFRSGGDKPEPLSVAALPLTREGYRKGDSERSVASNSRCFRCNRPGHHAKDCNYALVPKKSILENGITLTFSAEEERKLPQGTKFIRALAVAESDPETEQIGNSDGLPPPEQPIFLRALTSIQTRSKTHWVKRDTRVEIRLPWLDQPLLALFDCGADITVINAEHSDGAKMLDIPLPSVKDASDNTVTFVGASRETLIMGGHQFTTLVVWANLSIDAILGMDVIGPWMLFPKWSSNVITSEKDPSIRIPFVREHGLALSQYRLELSESDRGNEEKMYFNLELPTEGMIDPLSWVDPKLTLEEQGIVISPVLKHATLLDQKPTRCNVLRCSIKLTDSQPVHMPPRRVNPVKLEVIQKQVKAMLENGVATPSNSPYAAPVHLVNRWNSDGTPREPRFCVDYRRLNAITVKDQYYLPAVDDLLRSLNGYSYFAAFDLRSGFWQVEMDAGSRPLTAFTFPGGLYEYNVMPFGLCNAPATFQRLMDIVLGPLKHDTALVFMDDILVKGKSVEELARNCEAVLTQLEKANLRLNPQKIRLGFRRLKYLGHVISEAGISPDPEKVQGIRDFPSPRSNHEVQIFMGMVNYYRKFIPNLTDHSRSLETLAAAKAWKWTEIEETAFQNCKDALTADALLTHPDYSLPFVIQTDASSIGLGAVLLQIQQGVEKPLWYASRALSQAEAKYHARELECLAIIWALRHFRPIIEGCEITVVTDHESLIWLMGQDVPQGRLARWVLELQGTNFSVIHRKGTAHGNADALSRATHIHDLCSLTLPADSNTSWRDQVQRHQEEDPQYPTLLQKAKNEEEGYCVQEGLVCKKVKVRGRDWTAVVTPKTLQKEILTSYHSEPEAGHFGAQLTFETIRRRYYWKGMRKEIKNWIRECSTCTLTRRSRDKPSGLMGIVQANDLNQVICIDHVGPLRNRKRKWILVMMDSATRWLEAGIVTSLSSKTTAKFIQDNWLCRYGAPEAILTDNGTSFAGSPVRKLLNKWQVIHHRTSPYHPQANPVERQHSDLKRILRTAIEEGVEWEERLQESIFSLRNRVCNPLGTTPSELVLGFPSRMPRDLTLQTQDPNQTWGAARTRDLICREQKKKWYDRNRKDVEYKQGDLASIRRHQPFGALVSPYIGPFSVCGRANRFSYFLKHVNTGQKIRRHVQDLKPWHAPQEEEEGGDVTVTSPA